VGRRFGSFVVHGLRLPQVDGILGARGFAEYCALPRSSTVRCILATVLEVGQVRRAPQVFLSGSFGRHATTEVEFERQARRLTVVRTMSCEAPRNIAAAAPVASAAPSSPVAASSNLVRPR